MLVLSREIGQSIIIGGHIVLTVVDVHGERVRLGIEAPKDVPIRREEVRDAGKVTSKKGITRVVMEENGE